MENFDKFSPEMIDILMGIRYNNNKEWFDAHKAEYKDLVHDPMVALANDLFEKMHEMDENFDGKPKVCRVYRDTRFTKNGDKYKESKWFFLRSDGQSGIMHQNPTYFFEIMPDKCQYGFGFWPDAKGLAKFAKHVEANPAEAERFVSAFNAQNFFTLDGDYYKKDRISKDKVSDGVYDWCMRKTLTFWHIDEPHDKALFESGFCDFLFDKLKELYPLYKYFMDISS